MVLAWFGAVLVVGGSSLLWLASRIHRADHRRRAISAAIAGLVCLIVAIVGLGVWAWANTATDSSQFARALLWGDSGVDDIDRFPVRTVAAGDDPMIFAPADGPTIDSFALTESAQPFIQTLAEHDTSAFLVLHRNELLFEEYYHGAGHDDLHTSFSVAKSFTATLVGIAVSDGAIASLDDPITVYLPELAERDQRFSAITVRHLLAMTSGLAFVDGGSPWADPANTYYGTDLRKAALTDTSIATPPGQVFRYNDWNLPLLGLILERSTGMTVSRYLSTRLWQPMGAEADGSWSLDSESGDFEKVFVGLNARPIDFG